MFRFSESTNYSMPAHFGGLEGTPRAQTYTDATVFTLAYETDPGALARHLPHPFRLSRPVIALQYVMNRGVQWLAGGAYNLVAVNVPVSYDGPEESIEGWYALVVWENRTCPIIGGREQAGIPKVFADIEDCHLVDETAWTNISYDGFSFLQMSFRRGQQLDPAGIEELNRKQGSVNWFGWRYIPNIGKAGAALSHPTLYPIEFTFVEGWTCEGSLEWSAPSPARHPTQAHIIGALAALPAGAVTACVEARGRQVLRMDRARRLPDPAPTAGPRP